jgi:hypothetical protein
MPVDTIDSIKRRMIRNASKIWGYPDVQDINSFDPVLGLILGALAEELYNTSREIERADARVVDKLLEVLFRQNMFTHFPAHAIAYAKPLQARVTINDYYQFSFSRELPGKEGATKKDIWFTPAKRTTLFNGEIKYLFAGKHLYGVDGRFKEILAETSRKSTAGNSTLYLGIIMDPLIEILDGLTLFFTFKNLVLEERFYHSLQNATWKINGKEVLFQNGTGTEPDSENSLTRLLEKENNISFKATGFINAFYEKNFMTLSDGGYLLKDFAGLEGTSNILGEYFSEEKPDVFSEDILWVEIDMAQPASDEEIDDLVVSLNCFPLVNRELNEYTHSIVKGTNVIPLLTDDLFFDVARVSDSRDLVYSPRSSMDGAEGENTYLVRQGGIARFDSRDARETIAHLIDLVRDEAAAFSVKGADLISFELKQLDQIISRLQQRIDTSGVANDLNSYLIMESNSDYDKINVQFWSVAGEQANNIRPGSRLSVLRGVDLDDKSLELFTHSVGGRQKLTKEEKLNTLRRSLLSKGRIVTAEDIKALCYELFGNNVKSVEIKKGVELGHSPGKGMVRTLDIHLLFKEKNSLTSDELWHKTETLKVRLKQDSINLLPYRVFTT